MSNILTHDASEATEVVESRAAEEADSLRVGEELAQAQEQLLAGKYKDAQELEKAYIELQTKLGDQSGESQQQQPPPELTTADKLSKAFESYQNDSSQNDYLEDFKDVSKEDLIKTFFEASKSNQNQQPSPADDDLSDSQLNEIYNRAGGQESYQQMIKWAANNLSQEETAAFDAMIDSGNMLQINLAVDGVLKRYNDMNNQDGQLLQGRGVPPVGGYRSQAEVIRDMQDPRYDNDPAYRNDVMEKLARSPDVQF